MDNKKVNENITKEHLEKDIKMKSNIINNARTQLRLAFASLAVFAILAFWSYSGFVDPLLPNISDTVRTVFKVISTIGIIVCAFFTIVYLNGINRARKLLLEEIDYYETMTSKK